MRIKIDVTQDDIDQGCRFDAFGDRGGCMVHRAFMRATEGAFDRVGVNSHCVHWGYPVELFSFEIDIPIGVSA